MAHKSGFVNIIGFPNVGKSTLMNSLVGEKLSIITSKAQTTRHRIMGIVNGDDFQIVYSDTPGVLKPNYKLQESMMQFVYSALSDADIILLVTEMGMAIDLHEDIIQKITRMNVPVIVVINKVDLAKSQEAVVEAMDAWQVRMPEAKIIPVSALHKFNQEALLTEVLEKLPENPEYFPKDQMSDKTMRFFVSEIIREKILISYKKEIPYSVEVVVDSYKEEEKIIHIEALIYVVRESQKGILIGHQGIMLKRIGTKARHDIEAFVDKKVFLSLQVKVLENWRDSDLMLKRFGYNQN
ncbi:GTPase Era [Williamwhitmania taraxaci]|nr:GTPase Era [Williamwhitmania taraxaci]